MHATCFGESFGCHAGAERGRTTVNSITRKDPSTMGPCAAQKKFLVQHKNEKYWITKLFCINTILFPPHVSLYHSFWFVLVYISLFLLFVCLFVFNGHFFSCISFPNTTEQCNDSCAVILWIRVGKHYCHINIKKGQVQVDILKKGLWFPIINISPIDVSETGQPGNQVPQLPVAWKFTWHLLMQKHEKMFISVQIACKNLRGKRSSANAEISSKLKCMFDV